MSINNVQTLHDLAETSLVSYANPDSASKGSDRIFSGELINEDRGAGLTDYQAEQFAKKYEFIDQQKNVDYNGFSAMLLVDKVTQKKVLAMRGTEFTVPPQIPTDGIVADALGKKHQGQETSGNIRVTTGNIRVRSCITTSRLRPLTECH